MNKFLLVGLGGAVGSMLRFSMGLFIPKALYGIPLQLIIVNVIGCFLMGCISELLAVTYASENLRFFLLPGLLGGFTSFSAFSAEFGILAEKQMFGNATIYVLLSVALALLAFLMGVKLIKVIFN